MPMDSFIPSPGGWGGEGGGHHISKGGGAGTFRVCNGSAVFAVFDVEVAACTFCLVDVP